ncbi:MAG: hypothetical protein E6H06_04540 [Bacteroidetes bacterium]|nr:MAG: hypothetical protein E6H06_04540 [Bacteroidota bacterium]
MKANQKNKQPDKRTRKRKRETLEERVRRHLTDINSEITDDDIRSVRTELEIRGETSPVSQPIPNEENQPQEETSEKKKKMKQVESKPPRGIS